MEKSRQQKFKFQETGNSSFQVTHELYCLNKLNRPSTPLSDTTSTEPSIDSDDPSFMLFFSDAKPLPQQNLLKTEENLTQTIKKEKQHRRRDKETYKQTRWTMNEDRLLLDLYLQYPVDWKTISKQMINRAPDAVKNRFYGVIKRNATLTNQKFYSSLAKSIKDKHILFKSNYNLIGASLSEFKLDVENKEMPLNQKERMERIIRLRENAEKMENELRLAKEMLQSISK